MKTNYNSAIGEWLMNQRIRQGLSLQDIADRLQVSKSAVYYWEVGKRTIYAENMINYCNALNVSPSKLMDDIMPK
jgi:transcriptional regulator with XRE-family HTH domain